MGQGLSGSSKPIIASTGQQQGTISDSGRSSIRTIRGWVVRGGLAASPDRGPRSPHHNPDHTIVMAPAGDRSETEPSGRLKKRLPAGSRARVLTLLLSTREALIYAAA